jgi:hypothetical protein
MSVPEPFFRIVEGATYTYVVDLPRGCKGKHYRVLFFVVDVPSYAEKVCVEAIDGPDAGLRFTCSPSNFAMRYEPVAEAPETSAAQEPIPERVAGHFDKSSGV